MALLLSTKASTSAVGSWSDVAKERSELLLMINCGSKLSISAADNNGILVRDFCITTPYNSLPSCMGFTVIGSDLHMIGGFSPSGDEITDLYSLKTYVLDVGKIPEALASDDGLSGYLTPGPLLGSGKICPAVYIVGEYIYALSGAVHGRKSTFSDFEFRHLNQLGWTKLPNLPVPDEFGVRSSFATLESHALAGKYSIVISLVRGNWRGLYVFDTASSNWSSFEQRPDPCHYPIGFTGQAIPHAGFCFALSAQALQVFPDDLLKLSSPVLEFKLRETAPEVSFFTTHTVAVMGGVIFIIRSGSPREVPCCNFDGIPIYITVDRYELSLESDVTRQYCTPHITELDHSDPLPFIEDFPFGRGSSVWLHCLPVSLSW